MIFLFGLSGGSRSQVHNSYSGKTVYLYTNTGASVQNEYLDYSFEKNIKFAFCFKKKLYERLAGYPSSLRHPVGILDEKRNIQECSLHIWGVAKR